MAGADDGIIDLIQGRVSMPRLTEPGPDSGQVTEMLKCALRAPDHRCLRPWYYHVIEGDGREALGELFVEALKVDDPAIEQVKLDNMAKKTLRAPLIIAAVAKIEDTAKVPKQEQVSAVSAGVQNIQLAAKALGFGCIWRTGKMAFHPVVKRGLGLASEDEIIAFLYVGTPAGEPKQIKPLALTDYTGSWPKDD